MVTILEPREVIPVEPAPAPEPLPPRTERPMEWGYSMPCAGVKCFGFRTEPRPAPVPVPQFLPVKLIDERVILL